MSGVHYVGLYRSGVAKHRGNEKTIWAHLRSAVFPTGHAFGITREDGVEILVHIGINTVELNGKGFTLLDKAVADGAVKAGEPLVKLDLDLLRDAGYDLTTMLIVTNAAGSTIHFKESGEVTGGEVINL